MLNYIELNNMTLPELKQAFNRQAEKYNKQVTRAKSGGFWRQIQHYNPNTKRFKRMSKTMLKELEKLPEADQEKALIKAMAYREAFAGSGYTKRALKTLKARNKALQEMYNLNRADAAKLDGALASLEQGAQYTREVYYEIMRLGVELGEYNSFSALDKPDLQSKSDYEAALAQIIQSARNKGITDLDFINSANEMLQEEQGAIGRWLKRFV